MSANLRLLYNKQSTSTLTVVRGACNSDERGLSYLKDRGISVETCRRLGLGFDAAQQAIIVPQGSGYLSRSIRPDATQKDKCRHFPKGAPREIFNVASLAEAAKANTPVFIVEGEIDALSVCEGGGVASLPCRGDPPPANDQPDAPKTIDEIIETRDRNSPPTKNFPDHP